ncbi:hypothetical protein Q8A67_010043 [Cirrhinus molitorella]|uniref:STAS domain-containing protein n=1 Tax=Cirrhinus molitorella TaxID=172907 RepID=A0AA88PP37_9TELE|nr:hypothetical protein Q8A67_010043 [Cirrhinus molitorella]
MEGEMQDRDLRKRVPYNIQRDVLDELSVDQVAQKSDFKISGKQKLKDAVRCTGPRFKSCFFTFVPLFAWLPRYPFRENAIGDLISGISVGIMHLPQGMAYALLAAVPPVFGLYSSFYPILIYFIFGTSKHISVGTYAVMSVMIGSVTERLAPDSNFILPGNDTNSTIVDIVSRDAERVKIAATVTFLSGIFQLLLGLVRFGFVVTYLSEPLVRAYTTGAAIHVIVSQLKYSFGISPERYSGPLSLIYTVIHICALLGKTNIGTLVVSIVTIIGLIIAKELSALAARKIPIPIPVELITIIIATVVSWQMDLKAEYGVEVVGQIPSGLQAPVAPAVSLLGSMIGDAFALAVVGYGIAISLGRIFALKYAYKVDSNQELIALGLSNSIGGLFNCFAISCSMSRSMVQVSTGGKSQVAGAISAVVILVILLKIGELFEELPKAVLAAIIYVNLHGMMKQFGDIRSLWRTNRVDMVVWVMTLILTVLLNPDLGLAASIAFSILTVVFRTQLPKYSILGQVPGTDIYKPVEDYNQVKEIPGVMIFRSSATLYFANAEMYIDALYDKTGVDVAKLLSHKKKLEAKRLRKEKKAAKKAKKEAKKRAKEATRAEGMEPQFSDTDESGEETEANGDVHTLSEPKDLVAVEVGSDPDADTTLPRAIILDLSPVNFLDTVGVKTLRNIHKDYGEAGVQVYLSGCQRGVVESMEKGDFFNKTVTKSILFSSVHDAVLYCQQGNSKEVMQGTHFIQSVAGSDSALGGNMPEPEGNRRSPQGVPYTDLPHIVNADGLHLFCRYWEPDSPPKALVFVAHGAGEHCGGYADIAHSLTQHGILVFAHDHVGHGQSEGERMDIKNFQIYIRDVLQHIDIMKGRYPKLPVFIIGHSMGGGISILTACERPQDFAGVVLISPMVQMSAESATPFKVFLAKLLSRLTPKLTLGTIESKWVSRDPKQVEAYDTDELNYRGGLRISFGMQLMDAAARIERELPNIAWPFFILHGDADKLCDIRGTHLMYNEAKSTDKKLKVYEEGYHALHHDLPETVESVLKEWVGLLSLAALRLVNPDVRQDLTFWLALELCDRAPEAQRLARWRRRVRASHISIPDRGSDNDRRREYLQLSLRGWSLPRVFVAVSCFGGARPVLSPSCPVPVSAGPPAQLPRRGLAPCRAPGDDTANVTSPVEPVTHTPLKHLPTNKTGNPRRKKLRRERLDL